MQDDELLSYLEASLRDCAGYGGDTIAADREYATSYYFGRPRGDEIPGRSHYVSEDVSAMVEANLAQMLDAFSSSNIVEFQALGPEDEDQAQLESDTVSYAVMETNNGFMELAQAIKEALLLRNGVVKVWTEVKKHPRLEKYGNASPEAIAQLLDRPGLETTVKKYDPETGELSVRTSRVSKKLMVRSIPLENFFYPKEYDSFDLQDVPFCAERHVDLRSALVELGFPKSKVKALMPYNYTTNTAHSVRNAGRETELNGASAHTDPSQDKIEWYECYVLMDSDEDGIAERHRVCYSDETILQDVEVALVPYAAGAVFFNPHRFTGISLWDKLRQTQDIMTGLRRAQLDNVNTATKNRTASLDGAVNPDDLADGRTNGNIRVKRGSVQSVGDAIMAFTVPDLSIGILQNIQDLRQVRSEMGGAALDMASGQMQIGGDRMGSQGLDRAYSVMEQLAAMMTKNIAATLIRGTFLLAHSTLRQDFDEPFPVKKEGKWFAPEPSKWPPRSCVYVKVGMSPGERSRKAGALRQLLQDQIGFSQSGLDDILVNVDNFYKLEMDWARTADIVNPEQYFVDPMSPQAQQVAQQKAQMAAQAQAKQDALMQKAVQIEELGKGIDKYKHDSELQFKYWDATLDAEIEEAKIAGDATVKLLGAKEAGEQETASASASE